MVEEIRLCPQILQERVSQIYRGNLFEENDLNDLMCGLLRRNLAYLNFQVNREDPSAFSSRKLPLTQKRPGELDFVIRKPTSEQITFLEELRIRGSKTMVFPKSDKDDLQDH